MKRTLYRNGSRNGMSIRRQGTIPCLFLYYKTSQKRVCLETCLPVEIGGNCSYGKDLVVK